MTNKITIKNKKALLVVVDMVNGFINEGALSDPSINQITATVINQIEQFKKEKQPILAFIDAHEEDAIEFKSFPVHCVKGTNESALIPELTKYEEDFILVEKNSTNGFFAPGFQAFLNENKYFDDYVIVGCCTDICVLQFALTLRTYCNQNDLNSTIYVVAEGVDTFGNDGHDKLDFHNFALELMRQAGIVVVDQVMELTYE